MKITIKDVASYKGETTLQTEKRVNLIYGLNGVGKTTLSNFLYYYKKDNTDNTDYKYCKIEGLKGEKILVYNTSFIEDNFYQSPEIKGIFNLSEQNKQVEEEIRKKQEEIKSINKEIEEIEKKISDINNKKSNDEKTIRESLWEGIITKHKNTELDFCLEGYKKEKKKLAKRLLNTEKPSKEPPTINDLRKLAQNLQEGKIFDLDKYPTIDEYFSTLKKIEEDSIFEEIIVGNEDLPIAKLIKELNNSHWVKEGLDNYVRNGKICPFCQQNTLTKKLKQQLEKFFDDEYSKKINKLKELYEQYQRACQNIEKTKEDFVNHFSGIIDKNEAENIFNALIEILNKNLHLIEEKKRKPNERIMLSSSKDTINILNDYLREIKDKILAHNKLIEGKNKKEEEIKDNFWNRIRWDFDTLIINYQTNLKKNNKQLEDLKKKEKGEKKAQLENEIRELQKSVINIEAAIHNINRNLSYLGITHFKIEKYNDRFYKISREGDKNTSFKTLSEGEKTIITFLYFLEVCQGKEDENETTQKKIIVIDDPISSLSHIYIYNVSQLIYKTLMKDNNYEKIFILTHSLYFFYELLKIFPCKNRELFRIIKDDNNSSKIIEMNENEIENDYQVYWQIIKDYKEGKAHKALLPNVMRNILEHFFGFISKSSLNSALKEIDEKQFSPFIRYMNRGSHSDSVNINDFNELEPEMFLKAFKSVFEKTGYIDHYNKMIQ